MIKFNANQEDLSLATKISKRAVAMAKEAGFNYPAMDASMDIVATHCNGCPLDLKRLSEADDFNFAHDVFGIRRHIDRTTGELRNCFLPRFAAKEPVAA